MKALLILSLASFAWGYGSVVIAAAIASCGLLYIVDDQPRKKGERSSGCMPVAVLLMLFWLIVILLVK